MFTLKKDAQAFEKRAGVEVADGTHVADGETITIKAAGKNWIDAGTVAGLERTTIDQRRQHLDLHIVPLIGDVKLNKVTGPLVRDFQRQLREGGRSAAMVKRVTVSLGSILAVAQLDGAVIRNAVHELSRARTAKSTEARADGRLQVGVDIPSQDEIKAFLTKLDGRYRPLLVTAVFTGPAVERVARPALVRRRSRQGRASRAAARRPVRGYRIPEDARRAPCRPPAPDGAEHLEALEAGLSQIVNRSRFPERRG